MVRECRGDDICFVKEWGRNDAEAAATRCDLVNTGARITPIEPPDQARDLCPSGAGHEYIFI